MATKVSIPALIQALGGKENLAQATHCATRLRVTTRDKSKIDEAALKAIPGVLGVVNNGTQTQIIIGAEVNNVYKDFIAQAGVDEEAPIDENLDLKDELKNKKGKLLTRFFETVAAIFNPIVPALAGCGFLSALICIFMALGFDSSAPTFKTIIAISMAIFTFLPFLLAASAAKVFKMNMFVAMTICAGMMSSTWSGLIADGVSSYSFLGIPFRQNNVHNPLLARADDHRQRAAHGVQRTIQRQFAQHQCLRQVHAFQLPRRHQDADGNRQIERGALLSLVGGRKVHRQARNRHGKSAVDDGGAHAVAAFLDRRVRQSDNLQRRHPRRRVDLHLHCESADAAQAVSQRSCKHERSTPSPWYSVSIVHHIAHNYKRALSFWRDFVYSWAERMQHPRELRFETMRRRMPPMQKRWR